MIPTKKMQQYLYRQKKSKNIVKEIRKFGIKETEKTWNGLKVNELAKQETSNPVNGIKSKSDKTFRM